MFKQNYQSGLNIEMKPENNSETFDNNWCFRIKKIDETMFSEVNITG